jgi:hypothetical protein
MKRRYMLPALLVLTLGLCIAAKQSLTPRNAKGSLCPPWMCNYCGDDDPCTIFSEHENACPEAYRVVWETAPDCDSISPPLIDGMPECEAR